MMSKGIPATSVGAQQLIEFLGRQMPQLEGMLQALRQEQQALQQNDLPAFENALQKKQAHARALEGLEGQLAPMSQIFGGDVSKAGVTKFIGSLTDITVRAQLQALWDQFSSTLRECHEQNRTNHRIIEASRVQLQQALDILRGDTGAPNLYGSSGKQSERKHSQSIAVA